MITNPRAKQPASTASPAKGPSNATRVRGLGDAAGRDEHEPGRDAEIRVPVKDVAIGDQHPAQRL